MDGQFAVFDGQFEAVLVHAGHLGFEDVAVLRFEDVGERGEVVYAVAAVGRRRLGFRFVQSGSSWIFSDGKEFGVRRAGEPAGRDLV